MLHLRDTVCHAARGRAILRRWQECNLPHRHCDQENCTVKMTIHPLAGDLTVISLEGRLDIEGAQSIDDQFTFATTTKQKRIVVDLAQVGFVASIGIRTLLSSARGQAARGGRMVLARPTDMVRKVLVTAGVDQLMPIFETVELAQGALELS